jgi:hypothetical protein
MHCPAKDNLFSSIIRTADHEVIGVSSPGFPVFVVIYNIIFPYGK